MNGRPMPEVYLDFPPGYLESFRETYFHRRDP